MLLVHPAEDRWVKVDLSRIFFDRLKCDKQVVLLENAGHLPLESPGLQQMVWNHLRLYNSIHTAKGIRVRTATAVTASAQMSGDSETRCRYPPGCHGPGIPCGEWP